MCTVVEKRYPVGDASWNVNLEEKLLTLNK